MTAWPQVVDGLLSLLPTLPGWSGVAVYDGQPVTSSVPANYVTVGFTVNEDFPGTGQDDYGLGDIPEETGIVRSDLVCWTGGTDMPAMRARAFELYDAWRDSLRADPSMGVDGVTASAAFDAQPQQTTNGAVFRLVVTVNYTAR